MSLACPITTHAEGKGSKLQLQKDDAGCRVKTDNCMRPDEAIVKENRRKGVSRVREGCKNAHVF